MIRRLAKSSNRAISLYFIFFYIIAFGLISNANTLVSIAEATTEKNNQVMLRAILTDLGDPNRWQTLFQPALEELRKRHPELDIQLNYTTFPYNMTRAALLESLSNKTAIDVISVDQIWLGELAEKGFLADLTNKTQDWGKLPDFYEANLDGTIFNDKIYGIWAWTDVRGIWYWKDILKKSNVSPDSLGTWEGYLEAAKKINSTIQAEKEVGTSTLSGSWMPSIFPRGTNIAEIVGFLPAFPVPDDSVQTTTMMGGWQFGIPSTSTHKDLAWELITVMLEPEIFAPWLQRYGYLPTQASIGEGPYSTQLEQSIPYYQEMISMIEFGGSRPSIPEYSEISNHIKQALDEVFSGAKESEQALDDAATKSAKVLGWS